MPGIEILKYNAETNELVHCGSKAITSVGGLATASSGGLKPGAYSSFDAEMYEFFSVNIATVPAYGNACDALAVATSYIRDAEDTDGAYKSDRGVKTNSSYLGIWYNPLKADSSVTVQNLSTRWDSYSSPDTSKYEVMMFPSVAAGDINNDGIPEIVVAGYRIDNPNASSLNDRGIDNRRFLITYCSYDSAAGGFVLEKPFQWVSIHDNDHEFTHLGAGISNGHNDDDRVKTPLPITVFAERGPDVNNSVFVGGYVLALPTLDMSGQNASTGETSMGMYGGYDKGPEQSLSSANLVKTFRIRYATPLSQIDSSKVTNKAVGEAVSGNFISDPLGREQVIFSYFTKTDGSLGIGRFYADYCFLSYRGEVNAGVNDSNVGFAPSYTVLFASKNVFEDYGLPTLSIAAPDTDDDSIMVRYDISKTPDYFFSDPHIICVLQAASYFSELDYDGGPETAMTKTSGSVESSEHAVTIGVGYSLHFDLDVDASLAVGINLFSADISASISGSAGWQHETEWVHSTSSTFASGSSDSVVLTMSPYIRHYYEQWSPEDKTWKPMSIDAPLAPRTTQISVNTYDKIAGQNGWKTLRDNALGGSVAGDPTTYSATQPATWNLYDKGKSQNYAQGGWLPVGNGSGSRTQTISHERTSSHGATWGVGAGVSTYGKVVVDGIGQEASIDYTGGYMWGTFNAADYEGTVPNIPDEYAALYDYEWEFGTYMVDIFDDDMDDTLNDWLNITDQDELRKLADKFGYDTLVLGYRVQGVKRPPYPPEPELLKTTSNSVTFTWPKPESGSVDYYEVAQISGNTAYILGTVDFSEADDGIFTFTDNDCYPGRLYQYQVRAFGRGIGGSVPTYSLWSAPVYGLTPTQEAFDLIDGPHDLKILEGETAMFDVSLKTSPPGTPTYQWQELISGNWVDIDGETGTSLTMANVTLAMHGTQVRCEITARLAGDIYTLNSSVGTLSVYTISDVTVTPSDMDANKDTTQQFYAVVTGIGEPPQDVVWSVSGSDGSSFIDENGLLTIGEGETGGTLTVTATSAYSAAKAGSTILTMTEEPVEAVVLFVTVQPGTAEVEKGKTQLFEAHVAVQGAAVTDVQWSVNRTDMLTSIDENGLLTIGPDEERTTLTVTATSKADGSKFGTATVTIVDAPTLLTPPSILTGSLPDCNVGTYYNESLTADGDETIFWTTASGSLPEGLTMSGAGRISGTPAEKGEFTFTVEARNSAGSDTKQFTIEVFTVYKVTFNVSGGEVSPEFSMTNTDAQLESLPYPTRAGYSFDGWFTAASGGVGVTTDTVYTEDTVIYAKWTPVNNGQTGNGDPKVKLGNIKNGSVRVDNKYPKPGEKVNIDIWPDNGYEIGNVIVRDENGKELPVTNNGNGEYIFTYGGSGAVIEVEFIPVVDKPTGWNPFIDIKETQWFHDDVKYVWEADLMVGVSSNVFAPQSNTTRAMVVTILWRLEGNPSPASANPFADVAADAWYADAIVWANENEIAMGYGDGNFGADDYITREQLVTMLYRYASWKGLDVSAGKNISLPFEDVSKISEYAIPAMHWAYATGLIRGRTETTIVPGGTATRAELAAILHRFLEI